MWLKEHRGQWRNCGSRCPRSWWLYLDCLFTAAQWPKNVSSQIRNLTLMVENFWWEVSKTLSVAMILYSVSSGWFWLKHIRFDTFQKKGNLPGCSGQWFKNFLIQPSPWSKFLGVYSYIDLKVWKAKDCIISKVDKHIGIRSGHTQGIRNECVFAGNKQL